MALRWKTEYDRRLPAEGLTNWEAFFLARKTCEKLEWEYLVVDENNFTASTPPTWTLTEEIITIRVEGEDISFRSQSESIDLYEAGRNKKNIEEEFLPVFKSLREQLSKDEVAAGAAGLKSETLNQLKSGSRHSSEKIRFGVAGHELTFFFLLANAVVFFIMITRGVNLRTPSPADIIHWGGSVKDLVVIGEWWRLLSNLFINVGILALLTNLFGLYFIGIMVESILGRIKFFIAYLCCGVLGSLASIYFYAPGVSGGSSGAIAGLYGIFLAFATTRYINKKFNWGWFAGACVFPILILSYDWFGQIDLYTVLYGFIAGVVLGYLFYFFHFRRNLARAGGTRITAEILAITAFLVYLYINNNKNDSPAFQQSIMKLNQIELKAMTQSQRLQDETDDNALRILKNEVLPEWKHFQKELEKTDRYTLDEHFKKRRSLLHEYVSLRYQQTTLIYQSIKEHTDKYNPTIDSVSNRIEHIIDQIGD